MKRSVAWWSVAERAAGSLTTACDVARADAEIVRLMSGSRLCAAVRSLAAKTGVAWYGSTTARKLRPLVHDLAPPSMVDRVRVAGLVATVGSLTALALQALEPMRDSRLDSMLPAVMAVAGALVFGAARPLARALADKRQ